MGEMVVRDMKNHAALYNYDPIGFVDEDPNKLGRYIHGVRVLGGFKDLPRIMLEEKPSEVLVASPHIEPPQLRAVVKALDPFKVPIKVLPASVIDGLNGNPAVGQIRALAIEDLLDRIPV